MNIRWLKTFASNSTMVIVFVLLFMVLSIFVDNFFSVINVLGLLLSVSMVGMVACTMMFCLASGDFDLSVEAVVACSGVLAAVVMNYTQSIGLGVSTGILLGGVVGCVNGVIIAKLRINALITTLATMQIVKGLTFIVSRGSAVGITRSAFFSLGSSSFLGIYTPIWITFGLFVFFGFLLNHTSYGRNTLSIGGNKEAALLAGIAIDRTKIIIFAVQGLVAGAAGVVLAARMTSGQPNTSIGFSLDVISACVLGGVSLTGGIATISGVLVGVLIMGTVQNAMNLMNIPTFYQYIVRGVILLIAVLFDELKNGRNFGAVFFTRVKQANFAKLKQVEKTAN